MTTNDMVRLYQRGWSTRRIAEQTDVSAHTVWARLTKLGVRLRPRTMVRRTARVDSTGYARWGHTRVHRIVCRAWHGPPPSPKHVVNHIDGDKLNNHPENLEWATQSENMRHAWAIGLMKLAKLDEEAVCAMRNARRDGETFRSIADRFAISRSTASAAVRGRSWRHVTEVPPVTCEEEAA